MSTFLRYWVKKLFFFIKHFVFQLKKYVGTSFVFSVINKVGFMIFLWIWT